MKKTKTKAGLKYLVRFWNERINKNGEVELYDKTHKTIESIEGVVDLINFNLTHDYKTYPHMSIAVLFPKKCENNTIMFVEDKDLSLSLPPSGGVGQTLRTYS